MVMPGFFNQALTTRPFGGEAREQERFLGRLYNVPGFENLSPFVQRFYESQFNPLYSQFSFAAPLRTDTPTDTEVGPGVGFMDWLQQNQSLAARAAAVRERARALSGLLGRVSQAEGDGAYSLGTVTQAQGDGQNILGNRQLTPEELQLYLGFREDPRAGLEAATGGLAGIHPLFQRGVSNALQRLYFKKEGRGEGVASGDFLRAALAAGLIV